jgi:uncharacterized protein YdeI (YjbR/CyaY-like superfamily)
MQIHNGLPILSFPKREDLRAWLEAEHNISQGIWVRLFKKSSGIASISFDELLDEGLCFGWSESLRHKYDDYSYLQKFTPRKRTGTTSERNKAHIKRLVAAGLMTPAGLAVLPAEDLE